MCKRLLGRDVGELVTRVAAERPAARGQHDAPRLAELRTLEERRVLAVHGDEAPAAARVRGEGELTGRDETLLVRQRERDAALEGPDRRGQPCEAERRVEDDVGLRAFEQLRRVAADLSERREPLERRRAGSGRHELEPLVGVDHLERLPPDRPGGAQEGDPLHGDSVPAPGPIDERAPYLTTCDFLSLPSCSSPFQARSSRRTGHRCGCR